MSGDGHDSGGGMRWLLTYADMITLLMAFFIMMYSISNLSLDKFKKAAGGFRQEFGAQASGGGPGGTSLLPHPSPAPYFPLEEDVQSVEDQLLQYIRDNDLDTVVRTRHEARGLVISLVSDNLLFPVGEADLRPPALAILDQITELLRSIPNAIVVEGHTCSLPIHTPRHPSNWELSAARACAVVRYLIDRWRFDPLRLAATGYGDSRPVALNTTEEGRARNRRVQIVILAQGAPASPDAPDLEDPASPDRAPAPAPPPEALP